MGWTGGAVAQINEPNMSKTFDVRNRTAVDAMGSIGRRAALHRRSSTLYHNIRPAQRFGASINFLERSDAAEPLGGRLRRAERGGDAGARLRRPASTGAPLLPRPRTNKTASQKSYSYPKQQLSYK